MSKSMKLGGGGRFEKLSKEVGSPALAAWIGRKKYGAEKFSKISHSNKAQHFTQGGVPGDRGEHYQRGNAVDGREKGMTDCGYT